MKKKLCFVIFFSLTIYILADQVEATNNGIANASPGDYIIRANGEKIVLKQVDIDYARRQLGLNTIQYNQKMSYKSSSPVNHLLNIVIVIGIIFFLIWIIRKNSSITFKKRFPYQNKTYIDQNGYRRFIDTDKLVHRYVVEKEIGRKLYPGEVVHHKNRNKLDNSPNNLQVFESQEEHDRVHKQSGWYY